jgi:long-subunit acyl-CoA synthetase (AMP-forming)
MGEYVSLNKVESALKLHEVVETLFVSARSSEQSTVAIVVPDKVILFLDLIFSLIQSC